MKRSSSITLRSRGLLASACAGWLAALPTALPASAADGGAGARRPAAELFADAGELRNPAARRRAAEELKRSDDLRRADAAARALRLGLPLRFERAGGHVRELAGFEGDQPLYLTTLNALAAISTGADLLRAAPYFANGTNVTVGLWDAGSVRVTHQEFGGRVTSKDGAAAADHSTHVGGTLGAAGVDPAARGMAPAVRIDSYDWNSDASEMTARGASYPGEPGTLTISNHSYGYLSGWAYLGGTPKWEWYGAGITNAAIENDFGRYALETADIDALASSLPYYQIFWAAGNDRNENPVAGEWVALSPDGPPVLYDPALHPPGDGTYRSGYDTISFIALAKNVLSVGSARDAVTGVVRDASVATVNSFSSWGPTDDGRIKPDVVANGFYLTSPIATGDAAYGSYYGTSMATPNAAGTALLIGQWFGRLFTNQTMRASTLKALLIHTADDRGNAGPDYQYGWGLLNGKAAADLLAAYRTNAGTRRVIEDRLTASRASVSFSFTWDGVSPIRATLGWTDPAGAYTTAGDSRTPRLVNNLDLRVIGPAGATYRPWVMPFVGDWSVASCAYPATTGSNATDNVEQVLAASPGTPGAYAARVTFAGTLANSSQPFSLILSGVAGATAAPAPLLTASAPATGAGVVPFTLTGDRFMLGAEVRLTRAGQLDVAGANIEVLGDTLKTRIDTTGLAGGWWNVACVNPDGQRAVLTNGFAVPWALWQETFETNDIAAKGWSSLSGVGTSQWGLSSVAYVSPTQSMFSPGAATRSDTSLVSPALAIPAGTTELVLTFWHEFNFESQKDGGVLELSLDSGAWYDVIASGSGAAFSSNGYTGTINTPGKPDNANPLDGQSAWTGASGGFQQVAVSLSDAAKYAGHSLRVRWRLGTNSTTASTGWTIDEVVLAGIGVPPVISKATVFSLR